MGTVTFARAAQMNNPYIWYGTVYEATSSRIVLSDGYHGGIYIGNNFTFSNNLLTGGTLTSYIQAVDVSYSYTLSYTPDFAATGFNHDAVTANNFLRNGNAIGFQQYILSGNDVLDGSDYSDYIIGYAGNDTILGNSGNDTLDGDSGTDIASFNLISNAVMSIRNLKLGGVEIQSASDGLDTLYNMETLRFFDGDFSISSFIASRPAPNFAAQFGSSSISQVIPTRYTGPLWLDFELLGQSAGDIVTGASTNDFINLLAGDDAANGGLGDDVLDGGTDSNFLTGGLGNDTFFLDGRGGTTTWSTITDFVSGDTVNIWGWVQGTSQLLLTEANNGAIDYMGATYHYDLDGINGIDTSLTFSNLTLNQINSPTAQSVAGNGYLLFG
jgi:serralysin